MTSPVEHLLLPLRRHLDNQKYIELICRSAGEIWAETRTGKWHQHDIPELDVEYWKTVARGLGVVTGQRFSEVKPVLRGTLPGGHRMFLMTGSNVIDPKTRAPGICVTIRLKRSFATDIAAFNGDGHSDKILKSAVLGKRNLLVGGGMGSGKTTLTRILCSWIPDDRPISIEDSSELELDQPVSTQFLVSAVESDTDITNRDIVSNLQRSRADRFILGEITLENAEILMRLLNLGSPGTIGTIHCDYAKDAIESVSELLNMAGYTKNEAATMRYLARKIDMVVFVERAGAARRISEIYKPDPDHPEGGEYLWKAG